MIVAYLTASLCVVTRAILNVCDRQIFKQEKVDFLKKVLFLTPFSLFSSPYSFPYAFAGLESQMYSLILQPGIFFSAFGAQLAAYLFSLGFRF